MKIIFYTLGGLSLFLAPTFSPAQDEATSILEPTAISAVTVVADTPPAIPQVPEPQIPTPEPVDTPAPPAEEEVTAEASSEVVVADSVTGGDVVCCGAETTFWVPRTTIKYVPVVSTECVPVTVKTAVTTTVTTTTVRAVQRRCRTGPVRATARAAVRGTAGILSAIRDNHCRRVQCRQARRAARAAVCCD